MRRILSHAVALTLSVAPLSAQTADSIIHRYIQTSGGMAKIQAIQTIRRTGRFQGGGGFEAVVVQENKRPGSVREEFSLQGMTGINAYDGKNGWKIEPWNGKRDAEALSEEEMRQILEDADFDGPLIDYQKKGNRVELVGTEQVEGTDAYKLKVTLANGDVSYYYMDTEYCVPIKIETQRMIRGAQQEFETSLGDYKQVAGVYMAHAYEMGRPGSQDKSRITYDKIEANVTLDDQRFARPGVRP